MPDIYVIESFNGNLLDLGPKAPPVCAFCSLDEQKLLILPSRTKSF